MDAHRGGERESRMIDLNGNVLHSMFLELFESFCESFMTSST